jgi:8-oxo-dGTP pyrophosphatase MutT (NUDIX family)
MQRTEIVLAVVRCAGQICLARRSTGVATARGLWSVVTGYLERETDPLSQAWTELEEELGLDSSDLCLVRGLEPVPLTSAGSGKHFLVYPFLFESQQLPALVLNWEHEEVQWADPSRLDSPDCVNWQLPLVRALLED